MIINEIQRLHVLLLYHWLSTAVATNHFGAVLALKDIDRLHAAN